MTIEEAAEHYASVTDPEAHGIDFIREVFIAGGEWQEEQMKETHCPRSEKWKEVEETARHEYENGWKDGKEEMMKDAVEGMVRKDGTIGYFEFSNEQQFHSLLEQFQDCDKVRIIIVKNK